jgi:hypothetical protein
VASVDLVVHSDEMANLLLDHLNESLAYVILLNKEWQEHHKWITNAFDVLGIQILKRTTTQDYALTPCYLLCKGPMFENCKNDVNPAYVAQYNLILTLGHKDEPLDLLLKNKGNFAYVNVMHS